MFNNLQTCNNSLFFVVALDFHDRHQECRLVKVFYQAEYKIPHHQSQAQVSHPITKSIDKNNDNVNNNN